MYVASSVTTDRSFLHMASIPPTCLDEMQLNASICSFIGTLYGPGSLSFNINVFKRNYSSIKWSRGQCCLYICLENIWFSFNLYLSTQNSILKHSKHIRQQKNLKNVSLWFLKELNCRANSKV